MDALEQYARNSEDDVRDAEDAFCNGLSAMQQRLVPGFLPRMARIRECIAINARTLDAVASYNRRAANALHETGAAPAADHTECCAGHRKGSRASAMHRTMVENMLVQFYREWAAEGALEREECYAPAVRLATRYCPPSASGAVTRAMVPGAGFCRLAYDLACAGYGDVEACERSHAMALPAQWLLGTMPAARSHTVFPFVHTTANVPSADAMQLAPVTLPDVALDPAACARVRLVGGDFVARAARAPREGCTDVLVTCFFVDTANNVLDYIEAATRVLRPGGVWVNIGPLHWVAPPSESLRLTLAEIEAAMEAVGFTFLERSILPYRHYASPPNSFMPMVFDCRLWAARLLQ
jgi:carnosine N-methyltransferase